ncbi:MAG TPA: hypothetical protein VHV77_17630 [Pirellulales bacterium]|nr:hypothetical protein [Pirellulales bacterium]
MSPLFQPGARISRMNLIFYKVTLFCGVIERCLDGTQIMVWAHESSNAEAERMHAMYRSGGAARKASAQVVFRDAVCPHVKCSQAFRAIDFRVEAFDRPTHDKLVKAWWDDTGFAGRCPTCGRWIHFTIRGKRAIDDAEAARLPQLPANWASEAVIL